MKKTTTLTIDSELIEQAKLRFYNISEIAENALRNKLGKTEVSIEEALKCSSCGNEGQKESAETIIDNNPNALTWLYPDQKWICNSCLRRRFALR